MKYVVLFLASLLTLGLAQPAPMSAALTLLFASIEDGDASAFASALEAGAEVDGRTQVAVHDRDPDDLTPLMLAASLDRAEFVDELIAAGAEVNMVTTAFGWSALHYAVRFRASERLLASLIRAGADVDRRTAVTTATNSRGQPYTFGGTTPLSMAARRGPLEAVDALIAAGADVNAAETSTAWTVLHRAATNTTEEVEEIVMRLLQAGADPSRPNDVGSLPVELARLFGTRAVVDLLSGANMNIHRLLQAIEENDAAAFAPALANGPDLNGRNDDDLTPLMLAVSLDRADFVDTLIEAGADVNAEATSLRLRGMTALHFAARDGASHHIVASLIRAGADVNRITPLVSVESGATTIVFGGQTPLMIAAREDRLDTVAALIAAGADVNAANREGWTALHAAAGNASGGPIVASLLQAGADPNRADQNGTLPFEHARLMGNTEVAEELRTVISPATLAARRLEGVREFYDGYVELAAEAPDYPEGCIELLRTLPDSVRAYGGFAYTGGIEFVFVGYGPATVESTNPIGMMQLESSSFRQGLVEETGLHPVDTIGVFETTMGTIPQYSVFAGSDDLSWLTILVANDIASAGESRLCLGVALGPRP